MHVIRIAHPWKTRIFTVLTRDDGMQGIGEATVGQLSNAVVGALRDIEPFVLGLEECHDISILRNRILRDIYADGGQISCAALAGVEIALWDLIGKSARLPLYKLLGGRSQLRLRLYANGWYKGDRDPTTIAELAKKVVSKGYTALKIDPFGSNWRTVSRNELELAVKILQEVREAIGDKVDLIVEGHSRFDVGTARRIALIIQELNPLWFEEPLPYSDIRGYKELVRSTGIPIAAGESLWRIDQFAHLVKTIGIRVVQCDPIHVGGITTSRVISEMTLAHNGILALHSASGIVNELVCAHISTASPHAILLERFDDLEKEDPSAPLIQSSFEVTGGFGKVSDTPGIGAAFSLEKLLLLNTEMIRRDQNLFERGWELRKADE